MCKTAKKDAQADLNLCYSHVFRTFLPVETQFYLLHQLRNLPGNIQIHQDGGWEIALGKEYFLQKSHPENKKKTNILTEI